MQYGQVELRGAMVTVSETSAGSADGLEGTLIAETAYMYVIVRSSDRRVKRIPKVGRLGFCRVE